MSRRAAFCLLSAALAGCAATPGDIAPQAAPREAVLADPGDALYQAVSLAAVDGRPALRLQDGEAAAEARIGRREVARLTQDWLADAQMLSPRPSSARYLLTIDFDAPAPALSLPGERSGSAPRYVLREAGTGAQVFDSADSGAPEQLLGGARLASLSRDAAAEALLPLSFARFLIGLEAEGLARIRAAASCRALNPGAPGPVVVVSTPSAVGVDCPRPR